MFILIKLTHSLKSYSQKLYIIPIAKIGIFDYYNKTIEIILFISIGGEKVEKIQPNRDRRIKRTRQVIYESFISLILEKEFSQISIKDITNQANISRSTFYSHYQDKYDLLDKIIQEKLSKLSQLLNEILNLTT